MFNVFVNIKFIIKKAIFKAIITANFICKITKLQARLAYIYKHEKKTDPHYNSTYGTAVPVTGANAIYGSQWF